MKTIIPTRAVAKITARLSAGQDPDSCLRSIVRHVETHVPPGLELSITEQGVGGPGFRLDVESPIVMKAREVLDELFDSKTTFLWEGASIPVIACLAETSGAQPLLAGFGDEEDKCHAPNESFSIEQFRKGYIFAASLLQKLSSP